MAEEVSSSAGPEDRLSSGRRALELEQARLLFERANSSAISVLALVLIFSTVMAFASGVGKAAVWFAVATVMIGVTLLQPRFFAATGILPENALLYLRIHTLVSGATGAVWGIGAAWMADPLLPVSVYTGVAMVVTITLGGISPQSAFRQSYVALATMTMLPFAVWVLFAVPWPVKANGIGIVVAYAFFMAVSARVEIGTRDLIAAKRNTELAEELRRQRDAVQKANEEKTRFLAATSHDLAQPLHAQGFYLSALRKKIHDPEALALVDKVAATWRSLGQLMDGLVEINRLDAGAIVPTFVPVALRDHAERVLQTFEGVASEKGVQLRLDGGDAVVRTDPALLSRIVGNLVSNAVKFSSSGDTVTLSISDLENGARIAVADTGMGIPLNAQSNVFNEYVQLGNPERNREKGLGLGLSIVQRLATLLSIDVSLHSTPGESTTVYLELPSARLEAGEPGEGLASIQEDRQAISSLCVLIVDDEEAIRLSMSEVLTSWGCEVFTTDGQQDIAAFLERMDATPDVVIADHHLGNDMDGLKVIDAVRAELNEMVFAILMTGDAGFSLNDMSSGQTKILFKPVEPAELKALLVRSRERV